MEYVCPACKAVFSVSPKTSVRHANSIIFHISQGAINVHQNALNVSMLLTCAWTVWLATITWLHLESACSAPMHVPPVHLPLTAPPVSKGTI